MLEIRCYELPPIGTNAYLVLDTESKNAVLFDAPLNAFSTMEKVLVKEGYNLEALCLTHGHWDHMLDGHKFNQINGLSIYGHQADQLFFETPSSMSAFSIPGLTMEGMTIDRWLSNGNVITLLGREVEIRHVPGHSPGSILFWFKEDQFAVCGDAIFKRSIGRTDFPGCSFEQLENSIQKQIYTLPINTRLLPGHGPETTVDAELKSNPYVRPL